MTPKEETLWDTFIENYKVSITNGLDLTTENQLQIQETRGDSLKYVKWALIGAFVFGVPSGILDYISGIDTLAPMGALIGAAFFIASKINQERKKYCLLILISRLPIQHRYANPLDTLLIH